MAERDENGRYQPGHAGGPGRPKKGHSLTDALEAKIDKEELATMLIDKAKSGDITAMKYVYDRIEGKPTETVYNNNQDAPKVVEIVPNSDTTDSEDTDTMEE